MKKKLIVFLAVLASLVCLLAISASADSINPSTSNEYGTLTTFDTEIGNTGISPNKGDGTIARSVIYDGTNYYTVPTVYLLIESPKTVSGQTREMFKLDFAEISSKLEKTIDKNSIIRIEFPSEIYYIGNGMENLNNCKNVVEVILNDDLRFWGNDQGKAFTHCENLVSIDLSGMIIEYPNNAFALFEYCYKLESVILPDAYHNGTNYINYDTNHMFSGCYKLKNVENAQGFFQGVTSLGYKTFYNCYMLPEPILWEGLVTIEGRAFGNCRSIQSVVLPSTVTTLGSNSNGAQSGTIETVFESCTSLKMVVFSEATTQIGQYCFEKCTALEKVWMPAPWLENSSAKLTMGNQVFGQAKKSGVKFYLMCSEAEMATYIDQSAYTSDNNTDAWKHGEFIYGATLSDKCTIFLGGHEKPASVNSCTSGGNCVVCATALEGIASTHNLLTTVTYENGFDAVGIKKITCQNWENCTVENVTEELEAIFSAKGYSYKEGTGKGLSGGFNVNLGSLNAYKSANPDDAIKIKLFIVNPNYLGDTFFDENGSSLASKGFIEVEMSEIQFASYDYMLSGFDLDLMQNLELAFALIIQNNDGFDVLQKQYDTGSSIVKNTYTDANQIVLTSVTVESIAPDVVAGLKKDEQ